MELTLSGLTTAQFEGPVTIELPSYMYPLEAEEMVEAKIADNRAELALAVGRHPSNAIVFITGDGSIWEIDWETQLRERIAASHTPVTPEDYGHTIKVHSTGSIEIDTGWAIKHSVSLMSFGTATQGPKGPRVQYLDE